MKDHQNDIWIGAADKANPEAFFAKASEEFSQEHFAETLSNADDAGFAPNRRDFLKLMGFSLGAATVAAGCEIPVRKAIPYVSKPDEIVPGVANYFASSFVNGGDYAPVLVKTREGRPIKIEGNTLSSVTKGGTSARAQASVLSLYDTHRIQSAGKISADGKVEKMDWTALDREVKSKLGGSPLILAGTILSPTAKMALANFVQKYPSTQVAQIDPVSASALLSASKKVFPTLEGIPNYDFSAAETIVSFGADFLGTWISPVEFSRQYAANRKVTNVKAPKMSRHYQVESFMSLTGSNADHRVIIRPSEMGAAIASLYNELGGGLAGAPAMKSEKASKAIKKMAAELRANAGKSLVVCGSNNEAEQILCLRINAMLGNIGTTVSTSAAFQTRQGDEIGFQNAVRAMAAGQISSVIVWGCNPAYEAADAAAFAAAFSKVPVRVSMNSTVDETTALSTHVAPASHGLESWGDAEAKSGFLSLMQPTIAPLFATRQAEESFLAWADQPTTGYDFLKSVWEREYFPKQTKYATFQAFWDMALHDGVFEMPREVASIVAASPEVSGSQLSQPSNSEIEIQFFETVNVGGGQYSNNPWLMEMPDPVTRVSWDNVLMVPAGFDGVNHMTGFKDLVDGDKVTLKVNGKEATVVVARTFGMAENTVALALGYGREKGGAGSGYGTNANAFLTSKNGLVQYFGDAEVSGKTGMDKEFACVQYHHTMGVKAIGKEEGTVINADEKSLGYKGFQGSLTDRSVIFQANLPDLTAKTKEPGEKHPMNFVERLQEKRKDYQFLNDQTIYGGHDREYSKGLHWGMHVDLNACTGCGACTVACMSENNVPVVGKKEVSRHHEMTWLRIDRYYYGDIENPSVVYQPMMCQHCDNAPCENVCPVAATSHSMEGLNQMTYNRCIGTRYCANNCPYKVRRFNWLDYTTADLWPANEYSMFKGGADKDVPFYADNLVRMVMNPDVTVRSRGVIEKCSFCVQRIQEGKLTAKREARALADNDVRTACQTACPTEAITFGNFRNPESSIAKKRKNELNYIVLEEVNVASNVQYTAKITNKDEQLFS